MEGSLIRGPFSLGERSALKLGTKIYGATVIGPHCKVGGEVTITDTSGAAVDVAGNTTGTNVSSEQFSNFPLKRLGSAMNPPP